MSWILGIIDGATVVLGLGLLIFIHELGHFLMAKRHGVRVEAFSLGMGPILWRRLWNGTEYRISAIPLGGYVKMAGENIGDPRSGAPDELQSKTAWQRFQIFAAGAVMNLLIAFPLAILAFMLGLSKHVPYVYEAGMPEARAGMRPGDLIVEIDGKPVETMEDYRKEIIRKPGGSKVPVKVRRGDQELTLEVVQSGSEKHGATRPMEIAVPVLVKGSPAERAGLQAGDFIAAIDGERVISLEQVQTKLRSSAGKEVTFTLRRAQRDGPPLIVEAKVAFGTATVYEWPIDLRHKQPVVRQVVPGTPAGEAKLDGQPFLQKGDVVVAMNGKPVRAWPDVAEAVGKSADVPVKITRRRGDAEATLEVTPIPGPAGDAILGIIAQPTSTLAEVPEGSFWHEQGLRGGDVIQAVELLKDPKKPEGDLEVMRGEVTVDDLFRPRGKHTSYKLVVKRGDQEVPLEIKARKLDVADVAAAGFPADPTTGRIGLSDRFVRRYGLAAAVKAGLWEPVDITVLTLELLKKLVVRDESPKGLAGPVGIMQTSFTMAQWGAGNLLWILALITVNLGVFNVLPIPILDGGHMLLLAIEKVRGAPPSAKFVERFQLTGLVLLLGLIVYVTFQDVTRLIS